MKTFVLTRHARVAEVNVGRVRFRFVDNPYNGREPRHKIWKDYWPNVDAIVFVVDSHDRALFPEAESMLLTLLHNPELKYVPFLVFGSKSDLPGAATEAELRARLGVDAHLTSRSPRGMRRAHEESALLVRPMQLFMCSAFQRTGYEEGLRWLSEVGRPFRIRQT